MKANVLRLRAALEEWLIRNELDLDTKFFSAAEWRAKDEDFHHDAELVLVFEGSLHTILNHGGDTEEFDDYIASFGFWYELGNSWNMGFYPEEDYDFSPSVGTYSQKLQDPRWKAKAEKVKKRAGYKCQDCGSNHRLEVHHCYYTPMSAGHEPWEYPLSALRCLCHGCHELRANEESRMRAYLARLTTTDLVGLRKHYDNATYWFEQGAVLEFLAALNHKDESAQAALAKLLQHRNEDA